MYRTDEAVFASAERKNKGYLREMQIQLSDRFTYKKLLRFTLSPVIMVVFTSLYGVVDGLFVSNFAGKTPFAAVNFIMPFLLILGAVGFMFGTGGSALVSKIMGEGDREKANRVFSLIVYASIIIGFVLAAFGLACIRPVAKLLRAENEMLDNSVLYGRIILIALPAYILQYEFQILFATAEKPQLGLYITLGAGFTNIVLDALFVAAFRWGLIGAAVATAVSQAAGGIIPLIYFFCPNKSLLRLGKTKFDGKALIKTVTNGSSEFLSNVSSAVIGMLYNFQLLRYIGENGVAAYGVLMYVSMIFLAIFNGYTVGIAPIVGYNYGAENNAELKNLFKKSLIVIGVSAISMFALAEGLAYPLSKLFVGYDAELTQLTVKAFRFFSFSFLVCGLAIFGSAFFTALNNGLVSALISFMRTLVFQIAAVFLCPLIWGIDGIWVSIVVAEILAAAVSIAFLAAYKRKYGY